MLSQSCCRRTYSEGDTVIIGLDVGGTHTDAVLLGGEGLIRDVKVNTDPADLYVTVMSALEQLLEGQDVDAVRRVVLSTTLATNMVVQHDLPRVGMVVAAGPGLDPEHFRQGEYYRVRGALDHSGREIEPLDDSELNAVGARFKEQGISTVGIVTKFSVRNPTHELHMARVLETYVDKVFVGHMISGALSFPRRIATTYLNAAVFNVHSRFFSSVQASLKHKGINLPLRVLKPDGGNMNVESSLGYPAQTILSGPSASVMGALAHASQNSTCLVCDIGGTTTDMAVIYRGAPVIAPNGIEVGGLKTLVRSLHTHSIGIGGDSVVRVREGRVIVGPQRAGAAMALGGTRPTPTDALSVLGMFHDGEKSYAEAGIGVIARELGCEIEEAANRIIAHCCQEIVSAASSMLEEINSKPVYTVHEMLEGVKLQPDMMLVLGGPAGQFVEPLRKEFGGEVRTVPNWHVANAIGCALARTTCEVTVYADTSRRYITAQGENYFQKISRSFTLDDVRETAYALVRKKAVERGANPEFLQFEILEESSFNMVRGFSTSGRNIRVRAQIKPGLLHGYDAENGTVNRADL